MDFTPVCFPREAPKHTERHSSLILVVSGLQLSNLFWTTNKWTVIHIYTLFNLVRHNFSFFLNDKVSNKYTLDKLRVWRTMKMQKVKEEQNTKLPINASY